MATKKKATTSKTKQKRPMGRPTKYKPEYCEMMLAFFSTPSTEKFVTKRIVRETVSPKGQLTKIAHEEYKLIPTAFPFLRGFAMKIGVQYETLWHWINDTKKVPGPEGIGEVEVRIHPEFFNIYKICKYLQKQRLVELGLSGVSPPSAYIFTAKNLTDMRDEQHLKTTDKKETEVIDLSKESTEKLNEMVANYARANGLIAPGSRSVARTAKTRG